MNMLVFFKATFKCLINLYMKVTETETNRNGNSFGFTLLIKWYFPDKISTFCILNLHSNRVCKSL